MVELALSWIAATHFWINGSNVLVTVCNYSSEPEISTWYYLHPYSKVIGFDQTCPKKVKVPRR